MALFFILCLYLVLSFSSEFCSDFVRISGLFSLHGVLGRLISELRPVKAGTYKGKWLVSYPLLN